MRVSASDTAITFEFISLTGAIIDSYTIDNGSSSSNGGLSSFSGRTINNNASLDLSWLSMLLGLGISFLRRSSKNNKLS